MAKRNQPKSKSSKKTTTPKTGTVSPSRGKIQLPEIFYNVRLNCGIIMLFSFLLYANTLTHDYTQDDAIVIYDNMFTTEGVVGIPGILKYDTFYGFFKEEGKSALVEGGRYRPLTLVMFAVEWSIFGNNTFTFHLFTILLYGLTGVVLYLLLLQMLRPQKGEGYGHFVALLATLIFVAHPIHTEVVANIKGRDEIVVLLGSLAALYFSLRAFYENKPSLNIWAGVVFFLALLSKENAITFLAIVPLTYYFFTKATTNKMVMQTVPFVVAAGAFLAIRFSILGFNFGSSCSELMNCPYLKVEGGSYIPFTGGEKMATIIYTLGKYIQLLIFPHPLTHDYYPNHVGVMRFSDWQAALSLITYLGLGIYGIIRMMKKDPLAYGILFYLITLSIVSNIVFPVGTHMAERFMFMPSVGFSLVVAILGFRLTKILAGKAKTLSPKNFNTITGIAIVVLLLFSAKTLTRNMVWVDNYTLFTTDVNVSQNSAKLRNSAGGASMERAGQMEETNPERNQLLNAAVGHLTEAIRIHPNYKNAYLLLGNAKQYLNQFDEAIQYYQYALQLDPNYGEAENNMTIAYRNGGRFFGEKQGNLQKALQYLETANQRSPNDLTTLQLMGRFYGQAGNVPKSLALLNQADQLAPNNYETLRLFGLVYGSQGNNAKAIEFLEKALQLSPDNASIMFNLGSALSNSGQAERGGQLRQRALEIDPSIGR